MTSRAQLRGCDGSKDASRMPLVLLWTALLLVRGDCKELRSRTQDEAVFALSDNGLSGHFVVSGNAAVSEETAFKERLSSLLRANDQSLMHLQPHDITTYVSSPSGRLWSCLSERHVLAEDGEGIFVPEQVRLDFSVSFDHSRGISQTILEKSLRHVADAGAGALVGRAGNTTRKLAVRARVCDEVKHIANCEKVCAGYMWTFCERCKCEGAKGYKGGGTPQCVCLLHAGSFYPLCFSNSIYAVFMLLVGLCLRKRIIARPILTSGKNKTKDNPAGAFRTSWPNIGGQEFESDILACFSNMDIFCMTCCCPAIRGAMTYYYAGWKGYCFWLVILCVLLGIPGYVGYIFLMIVLFFGRGVIRKAAAMNKDLCGDICCIICLPMCVMCQDARHVDKCMAEIAKRKLKESGDLVGMAMAVEGS